MYTAEKSKKQKKRKIPMNNIRKSSTRSNKNKERNSFEQKSDLYCVNTKNKRSFEFIPAALHHDPVSKSNGRAYIHQSTVCSVMFTHCIRLVATLMGVFVPRGCSYQLTGCGCCTRTLLVFHRLPLISGHGVLIFSGLLRRSPVHIVGGNYI